MPIEKSVRILLLGVICLAAFNPEPGYAGWFFGKDPMKGILNLLGMREKSTIASPSNNQKDCGDQLKNLVEQREGVLKSIKALKVESDQLTNEAKSFKQSNNKKEALLSLRKRRLRSDRIDSLKPQWFILKQTCLALANSCKIPASSCDLKSRKENDEIERFFSTEPTGETYYSDLASESDKKNKRLDSESPSKSRQNQGNPNSANAK